MRIAYDGVPLIGHRFGIGHYTEQLIRAVARTDRDARCAVVCPWPVNPFRPLPPISFAEPNIELPQPGLGLRLRRRVREKLGVAAPLETLIGPFDVFHATNYLLRHPVRSARQVVSIHDLTVMLRPAWHPAERLREMEGGLRVAAAAADRIIAVSQNTKNDIVEHLGVDTARIDVVPLAVGPPFGPRAAEDVDAAVASVGLVRDRYLLFLGTMEPRKNLGRLLDALTLLKPDVGPLVLAGADGWGNDDLRPRIAALAASRRVRALGYVPEALRGPLIAGARAFVYPSLYEGFGLPPLEAMACGTPVITSRVSALPEVVGNAALLIDPLDVDGLADALRRMWDDDALRADLRTRGLARARLYTWENTARLTLEVYAAALRG
jgi:alpha-1,3-rhamnosyl/mannosyltransferase